MINLFTKQLPKELSTTLYREYFRQLKELTYHFNSEKENYNITEDEFKAVTLILSLSVFYNKVIMPLSGASRFFNNVKQNDISHIAIGNSKLSQKESKTIEKIVTEYQKMIFRFKIRANLFEHKSMNEFLIQSIHIIRSVDEEDEKPI